MIQLTIQAQKNGIMYKTDNPYAATLGELLTIDIIYMPDFFRSILISPTDEDLVMDACHIETKGDFVFITHKEQSQLPQLSLTKKRALQLVEAWEQFLARRRQQPLKAFYFKEEELKAAPEGTAQEQKVMPKQKREYI